MTLPPVRRRHVLALASFALALGAPHAEARTALVTPSGIILVYDEAVWTKREPVPPVVVSLSCTGVPCSAGVTLLLVDDPRPLPRPGAGAFAPGALMTTILAFRVQTLTPGGRTRCAMTAEPARFGELEGYWSRCRIEDRDLDLRDLASFAVPGLTGATVFQLAGPALATSDIQAFQDLLAASVGP